MWKFGINGVQTNLSANHFKRVIIGYTTVAAKTSNFRNAMVDYLVNSLGFSKEEASVTSSKVSSFSENPDFIVDYFKTTGFSQSQIKLLVSREPRMLSCMPPKTLNRKIKALHKFGFSKSDLAHIISLNPQICNRSLKDHIIPTLETLKSVFGGDNEVVINAVKNSPKLLHASKRVTNSTTIAGKSVFDYFKNTGFSQSQIKQLVSKEPRILSCEVDKTLKPKIQALHDFGFSMSDLAHVISLNPAIFHRSLNDHIIPTLEILKSVFGGDNEVLINAVKNSPRLLMASKKELTDHQIKLFTYRVKTIAAKSSNFPNTIAAKSSNFPISMVDFLVNSLGFSKEEASVTSSKVSSFSENANAVVDFFKNSGFSQSQIKQLVSREPRILFRDVDNILYPKIQAFHDFGFSKSDLGLIISLRPKICNRSLNDHIIPTLEGLKLVFGGDNEALINAVKNKPGLLLASKKRLKVEKRWIPSEANLDALKRIYKSYGFTDEDILTLARKRPYALILSESKLRNGLEFFMKEAGYLPSEIANVSYLLTYSFEKRVFPRYRVWKGLKDRGIKILTNNKLQNINIAFDSCVKICETRFFERYVRPFKYDCPDLYSDYVKVARPALF